MFFVKTGMKEGIFKVDVVLKGSQEDCDGFMVEASIVNVETGNPVIKSSFQPRPLINHQDEDIICLLVTEKSLSKVWKNVESEERTWYNISFSVKIVQLN